MNNSKKIVITTIFALLYTNVYANIGTYGFKQFANYYFVETGTFKGNGLALALKSGNFKQLYSVEVKPNFARLARSRFAHHSNVRIIHGNSKDILWDVIKDLNKPITFWLDAHVYPPIPHTKNCPLYEELEQIKRHQIKTHTILIDDMSCCSTDAFDGITKEKLIQKIKTINPDYIIELLPGGDHNEVPNNVLYAHI